VTAQKPDGSDSYGLMAEQLLPHGLLGLVVVGFFSHTMAMCSSDANAIAAVFTRDVMPVLSRAARAWNQRAGLIAGRVTTLAFLGLSMAVATQVNSPTFKDIITVVIKWVAGLMGPIAIPFILGLLRPFRRSGPTAALTSWAAGLLAFFFVNYNLDFSQRTDVKLEYQVAVPMVISLVLYTVIGLVRPEDTPERVAVIETLNTDDGGVGAAVPEPAGPAVAEGKALGTGVPD
jgi:Na+/proline symporter